MLPELLDLLGVCWVLICWFLGSELSDLPNGQLGLVVFEATLLEDEVARFCFCTSALDWYPSPSNIKLFMGIQLISWELFSYLDCDWCLHSFEIYTFLWN